MEGREKSQQRYIASARPFPAQEVLRAALAAAGLQEGAGALAALSLHGTGRALCTCTHVCRVAASNHAYLLGDRWVHAHTHTHMPAHPHTLITEYMAG